MTLASAMRGAGVCIVFALASGGCGNAGPTRPTISKFEPRPERFTDPEHRFSVTFPVSPVEMELPQGLGQNLEGRTWESESGTITYRVGATYAPSDFFDQTFSLDRIGQSENPYWTVQDSRTVTLGKHPAKRIVSKKKDGSGVSIGVHSRFRDVVVVVSMVGPPNITVDSPEAKAFFDTFQFHE